MSCYDVFLSVASALQWHADMNEIDAETAVISHRGSSIWGLSFLCTTFMTNFLAVIMIGCQYRCAASERKPLHLLNSRARLYQREVLDVLGPSYGRSNKSVLLLLIESGALYCCTWVSHAMLVFSSSRSQVGGHRSSKQLPTLRAATVSLLCCPSSPNSPSVHYFCVRALLSC